ncbi:DUF6497 family protein [Pseudogemmobacter humi]|uniref:Acetolactate synthase n=1 Tax=Pseudogemmobacter humi TaxID=2483812 RepID=A0A3P5XD94_9RHOB|nr:DUF6497 family protein [Pseudogemmobacter humi]VDC32678.1 hypothetical protein XINFAN_03418 [Pseudogemmobacter humi]
MSAARRLLSLALVPLLLGAGACDEEPAPAEAGAIALPSGGSAMFLDLVTNAAGVGGETARFRFIDKGLTAGEDRSADMQALCDGYALERIRDLNPAPQQIVITLADRPVPFGETDHEAVQFFEAYRIESDACIWEMF